MNDDELLSGPEDEFFTQLIALARRGELEGPDQATAAYVRYLEQALPQGRCNDLEAWELTAMRMAGVVYRRSLHAAVLIAEREGAYAAKKVIPLEGAQTFIAILAENFGRGLSSAIKEGGAIAASLAGEKASAGRVCPELLNYTYDMAREFCERHPKPARYRCAVYIVSAVKQKAKSLGRPFKKQDDEKDEEAKERDIRRVWDWLKEMPDAADLFK